ncbi:MAG: Hpt domain-containing protein [Magnetococcales bacterium]|nr:Hpt domain-containing protein [Magnetococcales bacterium]
MALPIDPDTQRALREELDAEDFFQVIHLYLSSLPVRLAGLRGAIDDRDGILLQRIAHTLKSASRQLGAWSLGTLCETLEQAAREGDLQQSAQLCSAVEQEAAAVRDALQQIAAEG